MFSPCLILFPTFLEKNCGGGGVNNKKHRILGYLHVLKPDHITGSPVVISIQVSLFGHSDIIS